VIEKFLNDYSGLVVVTKDAADYAINLAESILKRPNTLIIMTMAQLQKLFKSAKFKDPVTFSMDLVRLVDLLHETTDKYPANIMVKHLDHLIVSGQGFVSTTSHNIDNEDFWRVKSATQASVWWLQNPSKAFEAITTSLVFEQE